MSMHPQVTFLYKEFRMSNRIMYCFAALLVLSLSGASAADDKVNVTGTWKSEFTTQDGTKRETTYKLKQDGEKLTGTVSAFRQGGQDTEISDGTVKGNEISFKVKRQRQNQEIVTTYTGKIEGDTIKGKAVTGEGDNKRERDFEAKRAKE
jgi:hypothetical protein